MNAKKLKISHVFVLILNANVDKLMCDIYELLRLNSVRDCQRVFKAERKNGILLPKLFRLTVTKNCSSDREKKLKFKAEGREFAKFLRSLEQFIQTVKGQNNLW